MKLTLQNNFQNQRKAPRKKSFETVWRYQSVNPKKAARSI